MNNLNFSDPLDQLGYYSWNLLRAVRLVADTGIHAFGWDKAQAVNFIMENTFLSRKRADWEADR